MFFRKNKNQEYPQYRIVKLETKGPDGVVTCATFEFQELRNSGIFRDLDYYYKPIYQSADLDRVKDYKKRYEYIANSKTTTTVVE